MAENSSSRLSQLTFLRAGIRGDYFFCIIILSTPLPLGEDNFIIAEPLGLMDLTAVGTTICEAIYWSSIEPSNLLNLGIDSRSSRPFTYSLTTLLADGVCTMSKLFIVFAIAGFLDIGLSEFGPFDM